jgi:aryl-alcohol dehydrogenase-like predicted oxidoreductase
MRINLENSLKNLRVAYVDIFYVHVWDFETSIKEVMDNLHNLVVAGKVLYLVRCVSTSRWPSFTYMEKGISDTPAWIVSQANQYAIDSGKTPFAVYQGSWNVMDRAFEREIIPMAREHGMALCAWNVLASGKLRSDAEEARREQSGEQGRDLKLDNNGWKRTEIEKKMSTALEKVAGEVGVGDNVPAGEGFSIASIFR